MAMSLPILRDVHPRLYRPADDPDYRFAPPTDRARRRILKNILTDCEDFAPRRPWRHIPERLDSPHPFHQLYITFYMAMQATALIEHYAFAWRVTGQEHWLAKAKQWLLAASRWEHSDRIEEHFYTANRYMHSFALALDLLGDGLTPSEEDRVTECLVHLMDRWWPEVDRGRHSPAGGHHAVIDNGHFGVAAIHLLGKHPDAPQWAEAVIDRFRSAIMPNGCDRDGGPVDGPTFWPWENLWMIQFADALRNVVGLDLFKEFPRRLARPLKWLRHQVVAPERSIATGPREVWSATLLRLAQDAGDEEMRDVALGDPKLGRIYRFGMGVKGSSAECMTAYGPYAYCYFDPGFRPRRQASLPACRTFRKAYYGETAVLRSGWGPKSLVACVSGYRGVAAHAFSNLDLFWAGHSLLKTIACKEARPVQCGNLPCVGGQNEIVAHLGRLETTRKYDRLTVRSPRVDHDYWLLRGETPILLVALKRKKRSVRLVQGKDGWFARLNGEDCLQYPREPYLNPRAGRIRMRVRLREEPDPGRPQILFNTGIGVAGLMGTQVNNFSLGLFDGGLTFAVQSQRFAKVGVTIPSDEAAVAPGQWHDISASWGGFNDPHGKPFIEVSLDKCHRRCADPGRFGELGRDTQHLQSRATPRTFYIDPNTLLAFGGAIQMPGTSAKCDVAGIELSSPGRKPLLMDFSDGMGEETGSGPVAWKFNPVELRDLEPSRARLGAGPQVMELVPIYPARVSFKRERVPYAPTGLAAGSLTRIPPEAPGPSSRLLVSAPDESMLVLAFKPRNARLRIARTPKGFCLKTPLAHLKFEIHPNGLRLA